MNTHTAVLFYVTNTFRLTGSTINAIEYFLAAWEHNKHLKLFLLNGTNSFRRKILKIINDRYVMDGFMDSLHNIICIKKAHLPAMIFDRVLILDYMTINAVKGVLRSEKILIISEKYTDNPVYFLSKSLYNVTYYGEMPFHYKDVQYRMKCLFSRYKPLKNVQRGTYVNSPRNYPNIFNLRVDLIHLPQPFIYKSKIKSEENLFEKFTDYFYYHADKWFDPHPRLFLECRFYDKCITYRNPYNIRDGSWYRYNDLLTNGLENRTLNEYDPIIRQLI